MVGAEVLVKLPPSRLGAEVAGEGSIMEAYYL